jgi:methylmalonyl-CoA/ethylmalonyl-CoA epimerase
MTDWIFHHVGVVTPDVQESIAFYETVAGYKESLRVDDPIQDATIVILTKEGSPLVELIAPLSAASPAAGWLKRIQAGPYHTCYRVPAIAQTLAALETRGMKLVFGPKPAIAFGGALVAFIWGRETGLIELLDAPSSPPIAVK